MVKKTSRYKYYARVGYENHTGGAIEKYYINKLPYSPYYNENYGFCIGTQPDNIIIYLYAYII